VLTVLLSSPRVAPGLLTWQAWSALRAADRSGAAFAVLIGAEERRAGTVSIKDLKTGDQQDVAAAQATDWLIERLGTQ